MGSARAMAGIVDRRVGLLADRHVALKRSALAPMAAGIAVLLLRSQV